MFLGSPTIGKTGGGTAPPPGAPRTPTIGLVHEEIRQLAARYAYFTDAKDIDALVELYVPDVRISATLSGRETLHRLMPSRIVSTKVSRRPTASS